MVASIRLFLQVKLNDPAARPRRSDLHLPNDWPREADIGTLAAKASGLFIFAALCIESLTTRESCIETVRRNTQNSRRVCASQARQIIESLADNSRNKDGQDFDGESVILEIPSVGGRTQKAGSVGIFTLELCSSALRRQPLSKQKPRGFETLLANRSRSLRILKQDGRRRGLQAESTDASRTQA
ncbi:hypothetical protein BC835DRAFT_1345295 [Cytidiella melzeri]|nr:hypothetical protein BC835DRAFT_1345295 [Cytidiella melzeri]